MLLAIAYPIVYVIQQLRRFFWIEEIEETYSFLRRSSMPGTMNDILAVIMGGGRGQRLYPLTKMRSKPAVPIVGQYRLIDISDQQLHQLRDLPRRSFDAIQFRIPGTATFTQTTTSTRSIRVGFKSGPPSRTLNRRPGIKVPADAVA